MKDYSPVVKNVPITSLIFEAKITKNEKVIAKVKEHYEPIFCNNIMKNYGEEYVEEAKKVFPILIQYYFECDLETTLNDFLFKRSKTIFNDRKMNFDEIISSNKKEDILNHYIGIIFQKIKEKCKTKILDEQEKYEIAVDIGKKMYKNYTENQLESTVANYFNSSISRYVRFFSSEEKIILFYINNIGVKPKLIDYLNKKYKYILDGFVQLNNNFSLEEFYSEVIIEFVHEKNLTQINVENHIKTKLSKKVSENKNKIYDYINELYAGNFQNVSLVKEHYTYIIDLIFNKYKDEVVISDIELRNYIKEKYDSYFDACIQSIRKGNKPNIQRYINTRITDRIRKNKRFYLKNEVDGDVVKETFDNHIYLVDKHAVKYVGSISKELLEKKLKDEYSDLTTRYFDKPRKTSFKQFVSSGLKKKVDEMINYVDQDDYVKDKETQKCIKHPKK